MVNSRWGTRGARSNWSRRGFFCWNTDDTRLSTIPLFMEALLRDAFSEFDAKETSVFGIIGRNLARTTATGGHQIIAQRPWFEPVIFSQVLGGMCGSIARSPKTAMWQYTSPLSSSTLVMVPVRLRKRPRTMLTLSPGLNVESESWIISVALILSCDVAFVIERPRNPRLGQDRRCLA